jgi:hypothetical protein
VLSLCSLPATLVVSNFQAADQHRKHAASRLHRRNTDGAATASRRQIDDLPYSRLARSYWRRS